MIYKLDLIFDVDDRNHYAILTFDKILQVGIIEKGETVTLATLKDAALFSGIASELLAQPRPYPYVTINEEPKEEERALLFMHRPREINDNHTWQTMFISLDFVAQVIKKNQEFQELKKARMPFKAK